MLDIQLIGLLNATLQAATLLFIAALGELITEKSGILNLGVEGMIAIGAVSGFMTAINTENIFLAVLVGVLSSVGGLSAETAQNFAKQVTSLSFANDVAPQAVLRDIAASSQTIALFTDGTAENLAKEKGFDFLHVKTLGDEVPHPGYKKTRAFYENYGFKRLFQTKDLWDGLPTMLYVKSIEY